MNLIIIGPPGSGKGTQAKLLANRFGLTHVSSGELLRQEAASGSEKGKLLKQILEKGELVPSQTVQDLISEKLKSLTGGFILDGTPRTIAQAEYLDWFFKENKISLDKVLVYDLSDAVALERMLSRSKLEGRTDDTQVVMQSRLETYHKETEPIIAYYEGQGKVLHIDAAPSIEVILEETVKKL